MAKTIHLDSTFDRFFPFEGKSIEEWGFHSCRLVTNYGLFKLQGGSYVTSQIDMPTCHAVAKSLSNDRKMIVLDEESLDNHSADLPLRDHIHDQLIEAVEIYRYYNPNVPIGYYAKLPARNYWNAIAGAKDPSNPDYQLWVSQNNQFLSNLNDESLDRESRGVADVVDRVFPSLYMWYDLPQHWDQFTSYVDMNLREAAKYRKPIYVYMTQKQVAAGSPDWPEGILTQMLDYVLANSRVSGVVMFNSDDAKSLSDVKWWNELVAVAQQWTAR